MRTGARIAVLSGLLGLVAMGCASIAGIEDLALTGSPDAASDGTAPGDATAETSGSSSGASGSSSGTGSGGSDARNDTSSGGACSPGQIRCSGNGVQTCGGNGQWSAPQSCIDQTCLAGACVGMCAPGQTHPVPCGNCGMDTQQCTTAGTWQSSGTCSSQGDCLPTSTQACNTYGSQTCTASCTWGTCSCASVPACNPGQTQCATGGVETCGACGQYGTAMACTSGTCSGGVCTGSCAVGTHQCSGNGVQTCGVLGTWGTPQPCTTQTCINGACTGVCAPGQSNAVACGNCGTETQTCDPTGNWQTGSCSGTGACAPQATMQCNMYGTETCSSSCAWGACSCTSMPVCTPGAHQCSGNGVQTCDSCGQWGSPVPCGSGMTCTGGGTCTQAGTDCPGNFLLCDGFESGSIDTVTKWLPPSCTNYTAISVSTSQSHTGNYSLHVAMANVPDTSYVACGLKTAQTSIFSSTPMYFRAWVYMTAFAGADNEFLITALQGGAGATGGMGLDSTGFFLAGEANSGDDYKHTSTTQAITPNTWTCIELELDTDYTTYPNGQLTAWDSTSTSPDPALTGDAKLQSLVSATYGVSYNGPAPPTDFYFDDIAISDTYVGCDQ